MCVYTFLSFEHDCVLMYTCKCVVDLFLSDPSLTPSNMTTALDTLPAHKWRMLGRMLNIPESKLDQIESQFASDEERKEEVIRIYLTQHPHPSWEHTSDRLYVVVAVDDDQVYHSVVERLQSMFPTGQCLSLVPNSPLNLSPLPCMHTHVPLVM